MEDQLALAQYGHISLKESGGLSSMELDFYVNQVWKNIQAMMPKTAGQGEINGLV